MKTYFCPLLIAALVVGALSPVDLQAAGNGHELAASIVSIEVTQKRYDMLQPWSITTRSESKTGVVINGNEVLTTAKNLDDRILIRLQKGGRGKWWNGELKWIDYHANLALLGVGEAGFFEGLKPVEFAGTDLDPDEFRVARWRGGRLEARRGEFDEWTDSLAEQSFITHVHLRVNTEVSGLGDAEPFFNRGRLAGITTGKVGDAATLIPAVFIQPILEARASGDYRGLGFFDFTWQPTRNPDILEYLGLEGPPRGVVVIKIPKGKGEDYAIEKHDLILEVDGHLIDNEGEFPAGEFGHLTLESLSTMKGRWAGDAVKIKVLRDQRIKEITYTLPEADYGVDLVPDHTFDQQPEYLIVGGLVFQPLTEDFLRRWGGAWERRAPFRLLHYRSKESTEEEPRLVVLSVVIPDPINLGYQDYRFQIVERVNGRKVHYVQEILEALEAPVDGFHVIEFVKGSSSRRLVLDAAQTRQATERVLQRYGIPEARQFNSALAGE